MELSRRSLRLLHIIVILLLLGSLFSGYLSSRGAAFTWFETEAEKPFDERTELVGDRPATTVVTTSPRTTTDAELVALGPDGRVQYYEDTYFKYFDVDPIGGSDVIYAAHAKQSDCTADRSVCDVLVVNRLNLTTGETTSVYESPMSSHTHDVDFRGSELLVGDIRNNEVYAVDLRTGVVTFAWKADSEYNLTSGGVYPQDWTHLNDVEHVRNDTVMISLRNQDQVVFVDRERGLLRNWTLGSDDDHSTLYEQHNPDYIPTERGGPSVLVADSENSRIVEYRRTDDGNWSQSWAWQDSQLQWPRDADRLPNDNTLITDSNGNRVIEVNEAGDIVWSVQIDTPYEAERLGTGDESAGGRAAGAANLTTNTVTSGDSESNGSGPPLLSWAGFKSVMPAIVVNGMVFIAPPWADAWDIFTLWGVIGAVASLLYFELYFSRFIIRSPIVRRTD